MSERKGSRKKIKRRKRVLERYERERKDYYFINLRNAEIRVVTSWRWENSRKNKEIIFIHTVYCRYRPKSIESIGKKMKLFYKVFA